MSATVGGLFLHLLVVAALLACAPLCASAKKMPDFIPTCKRTDPNLNECARKNANIAIAGIVKGSKEYNIPNMIPLDIPKIDISAGDNLKIELTDNQVSGLEDTNVVDAQLDLEKRHMIFRVLIPRANIAGHYKMDGRVLILPIRGNGRANLTFVDGEYIYSMDYILEKRKGKEYLKITNHNIDFTTKRAYYHFENLFNGDNRLAREMNKFLDENWAEVTKDLGSTVGETISSIITSLASTVFNQVTYDDALPPL